MNKLGYSLVAYCGVDAIFVNNEEATKFKHVNDIEKIYSSGVCETVSAHELTFNSVIKNNNFFISSEAVL